MADLADRAQDEMETLEALKGRTRTVGITPAPIWAEKGPQCALCGNPLPIQRAEAGRGRCIECQERFERGLGE